MSAADPVLHALTSAATTATGATSGWLLAEVSGDLEVRAVFGADTAIGSSVAGDEGPVAFVVSSGQPISISPSSRGQDVGADIVALAGASPRSLLCVPCANDDDVVGALALVNKQGDGGFTIDDVEVAVLLGGIAGVAMTHGASRPDVPSPAALSSKLELLAAAEPGRFAAIAALIEAVLGD